jgi:hypothetical protein
MGCTEHLMQHAAGEAGCRQMRVNLGGTQRQAHSGTMPLLPFKLRQLHAQHGEPGAPVHDWGHDTPGDVRCRKHGLISTA